MGPDGYGGECLGCGNQEHFVNCADIAIGSTPVQPLPMPAAGFKEPEPVAQPSPAKVSTYAQPRVAASSKQRGPPYQVNNSPINQGQSGDAPVFDGTMASILSQVFKMASRANRIKASGAPNLPPATVPAPNPAPATPAPPSWTPTTKAPPMWNPPPRSVSQKPLTWDPVTPKPQPSWNAATQPWDSVTQAAAGWNANTEAPSVWNQGYATSTPAWLPQHGWQQTANTWVPPVNPVPRAPPSSAAHPSMFNPVFQNSEYAAADYAGNEPGEYPEVGELPSPGTPVPAAEQISGNAGYMQGFQDAMNQLKRNMGLSTSGNIYNGKINTALSELTVAMQEQTKQPSFGRAGSATCPTGVQRECKAGGAFASNSDFDSWCAMSCSMGQCPANMCSCTCPGGLGVWGTDAGCRAVDRTKGASMDTWCVQNCERNNCPADLCVCGFSS